jgi:hypothetical protein
LHLQEPVRIVYGCVDLQFVSDDPRILQNLFNPRRSETRNFFRIKFRKKLFVPLPLPEDGRPTQSRLGTLQNQKFKMHLIIVNRHSPFFIVVLYILVEFQAPAAAIFRIFHMFRSVEFVSRPV